VTYHKGDVFHEMPNQPHLVSRNASAKHPARLLAFILVDQGQPVTMLLPN
jgi:quercetin dioxygenase-like cupin family protein